MNGELILFPDVSVLVVGVLQTDFATRLPGVGVGTKLKPGDFVRVTRVGGAKETPVSEQALVLVEAYSEAGGLRAAYLLSVARAVLNAQDGQIFGVTEVSGPADLPDPNTSQTRFTQMFGVRVRGSSLA